ncbi:50S ribosomal protein L13 [candidate division TA06 bacterium DG_24]|uniref:Large ribosomal subunit protein uL13 n=3 Tax=Bacteria division TA06 TaxID=1156500 RepID=A0A0S8JS63_UNCT6|nr:MAG: 50S ribosomal protein L13 [candidate division TA06 bacterium DG_24]KPK70864.1 MAG: 50S ribosomal protein L13 [candidate division TA06 bacterium SM23_40]KPL11581.1 MAG: 50S ribosomal protein L13 [candidate division TA06 bacterium SM1_40]
MRTYVPGLLEAEQRWYVVDAEGKVLGRLASRIAYILRGKHRPEFTPHLDLGDHVIVINAEKVIVTGQKSQTKTYHRHSGYPGGVKTITFKQMLEKHPERVIYLAVKGMLPRNRLGRRMLKKLRVYSGPTHPHQAQTPEVLAI